MIYFVNSAEATLRVSDNIFWSLCCQPPQFLLQPSKHSSAQMGAKPVMFSGALT